MIVVSDSIANWLSRDKGLLNPPARAQSAGMKTLSKPARAKPARKPARRRNAKRRAPDPVKNLPPGALVLTERDIAANNLPWEKYAPPSA